jgi:hypothetical protein
MAKQSGPAGSDQTVIEAGLAKTRMRERTKRIVAVCTAVVTVVGVVFGVYKSSSSSASPSTAGPTVTATVTVTPSPAPSSTVDRTIIAPEENAKAPLCADVSGVVRALPKNKAIVIATREEEDTRTYFEQDVKLNASGQWHARVNLGDLAHPNDAVGHYFNISAVVMDKDDAAYLAGTNPEDGNTWWSSETLPPAADSGDARRVQRSAEVGKCD